MVATGYAGAGAAHDHDADYAALGHNHSGTYSPAAHDHDADYSATGHDHSGTYSPAAHDHSGTYSPAAHDHDASYATAAHNHDASYATTAHNHDASYATTAHNHVGADITSGTVATARLDVGTGAAQVAAGNHTHSDGYGAFVAPTSLGTGVTQRANTSAVGSRLEPGDTVRLRGAIDISSNPSSGTVLLTLNAAHAPVGGNIVHPGVRTGPTGNVSCVLLINSSGEVTLTAAPGAGTYLGLDGITFVRTVA